LFEGDLMVTEMLRTPLATYAEWFEIHNTTTKDIDLTHLWITDSAGEVEHYVQTGRIDAGDFFVFGTDDRWSLNGNITVDQEYDPSGFTLPATTGHPALRFGREFWVDWFEYDESYDDDEAGEAIQLGPALVVFDTDNNGNYGWCTSSNALPFSQFGSPGAANPTCNFVFISPSGSDANPGTRASPKQTLAAGITQSNANDDASIFLAEGTYVGNFTTEASVHGGFDPATFERDARFSGTTIIESTNGTHALFVDPPTGPDISHTVLDGLVVKNTNGVGGPAMLTQSNKPVYLSHLEVTAANDLVLALEGTAEVSLTNSLVVQLDNGNDDAAVYIDNSWGTLLMNNTIDASTGLGKSVGVRVEAGDDVHLANNIIYTVDTGSDANAIAIYSAPIHVYNNNIAGSPTCFVHDWNDDTCRVDNLGDFNDCGWEGCSNQASPDLWRAISDDTPNNLATSPGWAASTYSLTSGSAMRGAGGAVSDWVMSSHGDLIRDDFEGDPHDLGAMDIGYDSYVP